MQLLRSVLDAWRPALDKCIPEYAPYWTDAYRMRRSVLDAWRAELTKTGPAISTDDGYEILKLKVCVSEGVPAVTYEYPNAPPFGQTNM